MFGVGVNSIIVNSLPVSTAAKAIQILLSLDIFFTFLVVVVPSSGSVRKLLASISASLAFDADEPKRALSTVFVVALAPMLVLSCCLVLAIFVPGLCPKDKDCLSHSHDEQVCRISSDSSQHWA